MPLDERESLQQELALVGEGHGVLREIRKDLSERDVDGCSGLEIADGVEDIGGNDVAVSDAAHLLIEMVVAEAGVARIDDGLVRLPGTPHGVLQPSANREDAMRIVITRDGRVFFNDDAVERNELPREIAESVKGGSERKIYLAVDARVKYGDVKPVLDEIQLSGITQIGFLAEKP